MAGDWREAKRALEVFLEKREDGPAEVLLEYMRGYGFFAPIDWKGYRVLTDK